MEPKRFLTSGEVSEILGISRATVSRKFDEGVLAGVKNPITGKRLISSESLTVFMKSYDMDVPDVVADQTYQQEQQKVLVVSSDEQLLSVVKNTLGDIHIIEMETAAYGGEALIKCAQDQIDLLIIDIDLPDIPGKDVVRSLKTMNIQKDLKILFYVQDAAMERYDTSGDEEYIEGKSLDEEVVKKKIFSSLGIQYDEHGKVYRPSQKRRWSRISTNLPIYILIYHPGAHQESETGNAVIKNISYGGAFLSYIELSNKLPPHELLVVNGCRVGIGINLSTPEKWEVQSRIVRFVSDGSFSAGVEFVDISEEDRKNILKLPFDEY